MPKVIVLAPAGDTSTRALTDAVVQGAKGVRFTEVDVRSASDGAEDAFTRYRALEETDGIGGYDGVIIVNDGDARSTAAMDALLARIDANAPATGFPNMVFGVVAGDASHVARVAALGGILVSEARGALTSTADEATRATAFGARVATVVEWVRHALSHQASHDQASGQHHHH